MKYPDRQEIRKYLVNSGEGKSPAALIELVRGYADQHPKLVCIDPATKNAVSEIPERINLEGLKKINEPALVHFKEHKLGTRKGEFDIYAWDIKGGAYTIIDDLSLKASDDRGGNEYSQAENLTMNIFSQVLANLNHQDPNENLNRIEKNIHREEKRRRNRRVQEGPELGGALNEDLQTLANWAENFAEFKAYIYALDMMSNGHRDRTRIDRAIMAIENSHEGALAEGQEVKIYRAMPNNCEIQAGDWITLDKYYAETHLEKWVEGMGNKGYIQELIVDGGDIYCPHGDPNEWVYTPKNTFGADIESLHDLWKSLDHEGKPDGYPDMSELKDICIGEGGDNMDRHAIAAKLESFRAEGNSIEKENQRTLKCL